MKNIKPSFFIIGERKCGTSSLYRYLIAHPNVLPCALKEPNFFGKGMEYVKNNIKKYWTMFPEKTNEEDIKFSWPELNDKGILYQEEVAIKREKQLKYITGEASANTFYEVDPLLVKSFLPAIKLIILFRNPAERAFSHHRMYQRFQEEGRDLGFPINDFKTDILKEMAIIKKGGKGHFLSPGFYLLQLKPWIGAFGRGNIRIYFTENLKDLRKGQEIMKDIQAFLNLPFCGYSTILKKKYNVAPVMNADPIFMDKVRSFFNPYNEKLATYLQLELPFEWGKD